MVQNRQTAQSVKGRTAKARNRYAERVAVGVESHDAPRRSANLEKSVRGGRTNSEPVMSYAGFRVKTLS